MFSLSLSLAFEAKTYPMSNYDFSFFFRVRLKSIFLEFFSRKDVSFALDEVKVLEREMVWDEVKLMLLDFLRRQDISLSLLYSSAFRLKFLRYNNYSFSFPLNEFKFWTNLNFRILRNIG